MGFSSERKKKWKALLDTEKDRIVRMCWEDRTSFEKIQKQFGLSPNEVVRFMRMELDHKSFKRWRRRATERGQLKHEKKSPELITRFKCSRQRMDGSTKGWK